MAKNLLLIFLIISSPCFGQSAAESEESVVPVMIYGMGSCGEFIRAAAKPDSSQEVKYNYYESWVRGYITSLNQSLERGGNVLGSHGANISDFMILVENYCRSHPLADFIVGVSVQLKGITPIDGEGQPYKNK